MGNLFVVYTPFQLYIAQQIVAQEQLDNCVLMMSYIPGNQQFIDIYEMMAMEGMWEKKIVFENFDRWDGNRLSRIKDIKFAYNNFKRLKRIFKDNNIKDIYLGEIQNPALRFTDIVFSRLGYRISFYEEGAAHYIQRPYKKENLLLKFKIFLLDFSYYLPLYHIRFAKWHYIWFRPINGELPIYKRYSLIPIHKEKFDIQLIPQTLISAKIESLIKNEIDIKDKSRVLLMTDPLIEIIGEKWIHVYYDIIEECFKELGKDTTLYIKFHPRDTKKDKDVILNLAKKTIIRHYVLSKKINIPVEYYLQKYRFDKVYIFNASTFFYNGILYPKVDFIKLLPKTHDRLKIESGGARFESMERIIDAMSNL